MRVMDKIVFEFLRDIRLNNNREWFQENRERYDAAKKEAEKFVDFLIPGLQKIDPKIGTVTARQAMFRIYRDVRFSKDKSPYKTNFGAYISPGGKKSDQAGYYLHLDPEGSFIAGGSYGPRGEVLKKIRSEIYYNLDEFEKIIGSKQFKSVFGKLQGDRLVRPPQGFPADFEGIEYLKFKSYFVIRQVPEEEVLRQDFAEKVLDTWKALKPLNDFLNRSLVG